MTGLQLYENKIKQEISFLRETDEPVSYVLVADMSGSMSVHFPRIKQAVRTFIEHSHALDTYSLVMFSQKPTVCAENVSSADLMNQFLFRKPEKRTAFFDGVSLGLDLLAQAPHKRKGLILISDGMDNNSRVSLSSVRQRLRECNARVQTFGFVGEPDAVVVSQGGMVAATAGVRQQMEVDLAWRSVVVGWQNLTELTALGGGHLVKVAPGVDLDEVASLLAVSMRHGYDLGFVSTAEPDRKWRKLELRLPGCKSCVIRFRPGYFATK